MRKVPSGELAERDRGADCEALAEIVQPDAPGDESCQGNPFQRSTAVPLPRAREPLADECEPEIADCDAHQDEPRTLECARKRSL